jgi:hexosaminidase
MRFKKQFLLLIYLTGAIVSFSQQKSLALIPKPESLKMDKGTFLISGETVIVDSLQAFTAEIGAFNAQLKKLYNLSLTTAAHRPASNFIILLNGSTGNARQPEESYSLDINAHSIAIGGFGAGTFYAFQTLLQLLNTPTGKTEVPCLHIWDQPAYAWRGILLDVCRHFFTKDEIKQYLDYLAFYKYNVFHMHLTDDQGWRIEIKKYPLLTTVGSKRKETVIGHNSDTAKYDGIPYSGFYTQDDIREIVAYAAARHITIVPEIEMPGHAMAALASYPQFSCTGGPFQTATSWGVFDDVYCPKEETFKFLEDVLTEVCDLFPGKYVHVGGDECPKKRWHDCPHCQALMKKENLKNENELQSYIIRHMQVFLSTKGKNLIGWDEILEGGLAPGAAVMSWRGTEGGITAAKQKHEVVMSPGKPCYFDHYQSTNKKSEPLAIGGYNPLENVYAYNPMPLALPVADRKYILGAQGNVWTEYIQNMKQVEYMSIPRMCALAEVLWTPAVKKNYPDFVSRLKTQSKLLDKMGANYARHFLNKP